MTKKDIEFLLNVLSELEVKSDCWLPETAWKNYDKAITLLKKELNA